MSDFWEGLKNLFMNEAQSLGVNKMIKCPFCLTPQYIANPKNSSSCSSCGGEIPIVFIKEYNHVKPVWVHAVGYTDHGKTVYLTSLIDHIEKIPYVWDGANIRIINQPSLNYINRHRRRIANGDMPEKTPTNFPTPILIQLKNMARWTDRCFIMYDTGGENFADIDQATKGGKFIAHANSSLFIVSLPDLIARPETRINYLFDVYLAALDKLESNPKSRNIIITYTKADLIENFPDVVHEYLMEDRLWEGVSILRTLYLSDNDMKSYVEQMKYISNTLRDYTISKVESGLSFISSAESRGYTLRFTANTALGSSPNRENKLTLPPSPRRVLDPFLWILELDQTR